MIVQDVVDAIRKNGLPQTQGTYIKRDINTGNPLAACALGQAGINLGHTGSYIANIVGSIISPVHGNLDTYIVYLNDTEKLNFAQIADRIEKDYAEFLKVKLSYENL